MNSVVKRYLCILSLAFTAITAVAEQPFPDDLFAREDKYDCMNRGSSCRECLLEDNATTSCGYAQGFGCMESCNIIADISCYSTVGYGKFEGMEGELICTEADADEALADICGSQSDCVSCTSSGCQWFGEELGIDPGFCGSECSMIGCGVTTCPVLFDSGAAEETYEEGTEGSDSLVVIDETTDTLEEDTIQVEVVEGISQSVPTGVEGSSGRLASPVHWTFFVGGLVPILAL